VQARSASPGCVQHPSPTGTVLGHEVLIADVGCSFNCPESLHVDERELFRDAGLVPNTHGLIDSFDEALACSQFLEADDSDGDERAGWLPWLLVRYSL
jgi:hypothetical protein